MINKFHKENQVVIMAVCDITAIILLWVILFIEIYVKL